MPKLLDRKLEAPKSLRCLLPLALVALASFILFRTWDLEASLNSASKAVPTLAYSELWAAKPAPGESHLGLAATEIPFPLEIESGQTVGGLLASLGLENSEVHQAVEALAGHVDPRRIKAGEPCLAYYDDQARLEQLRVRQSGKGWLRLDRADETWQASWHPFQRRVEVRQIAGELEDLLDTAIQRAGGPYGLAYKMADVLQWDLDFNRDLQVGDRFRVLFEEVYLDGHFSGLGDVLALAYENRGQTREAYRFGEDNAYYDGEGRPLRKLFLRSPLPFTRVTSRFSHRRFHPVLKVYRPHYGVDYGAPKGTPVRATSGGVVSFAGWNKGGGKTIKIRHANGYLTAYLHLSGYAVRSGKRVQQGDVIGYVGSTGLSTGPHLDYRVQRNGRWIDPLSLPNVPADPIAEEDLERFLNHRDGLREHLGGSFLPTAGGARLAASTQSSLPTTESAAEAAGLSR